MFIVPSTFISCATRSGTILESTTRRVSITVSISAAWTMPAQQRVLGADADELRALQRQRRVPGRDADDRLVGGVAFEHLGEAAAPVGREAGDEDPPAHPVQIDFRVRQHRVELLLDPAADLFGDGLHQALVVPRLLAPLVGRDRLQEADVELRRAGSGAGQAQPREQRRDREVDQAGELLERVDVAEDRHRLLGADDRDGDDRRLRLHRRLDEAAAAEPCAAGSGPCRASRCPCGPRGRRARAAPRRRAAGGRWRGARGRRRAWPRAWQARVALEEVLDGQVQRPRSRVLGLDRLGDHRRVGRQRPAVVGDQQRAAGRPGRARSPPTVTRNQ